MTTSGRKNIPLLNPLIILSSGSVRQTTQNPDHPHPQTRHSSVAHARGSYFPPENGSGKQLTSWGQEKGSRRCNSLSDSHTIFHEVARQLPLFSRVTHNHYYYFFLVKFNPTGILNVTVYTLDEFHLWLLLLRQTILWHQCLIRPFPQTQQGVLPEIWWYKSWSSAVSNFYYSLYASLWKWREDKRRGREFNWKMKYYNLSDEICLLYIRESAASAPLGIQFVFPLSA